MDRIETVQTTDVLILYPQAHEKHVTTRAYKHYFQAIIWIEHKILRFKQLASMPNAVYLSY